MFIQENRITVNTSNLRSLLASLSSLQTHYCGYMVSHWEEDWKPAGGFQLELSWWQFGSSQRRTEVFTVTSPGPSLLTRLLRLRRAGLNRRRQTSSQHLNVRTHSDLSQKGCWSWSPSKAPSPKPNVSQPAHPRSRVESLESLIKVPPSDSLEHSVGWTQHLKWPTLLHPLEATAGHVSNSITPPAPDQFMLQSAGTCSSSLHLHWQQHTQHNKSESR